jgi:Type I phosphodiesterase / nucleotide pyrophosphatase
VTRPVLIVGVSGATWDVLDPLIDAGRLPALAALRRAGSWGRLSSVRAPGDDAFRPQVAWASIATGCLPERHGVMRFFHDGADLRAPALWDLWARDGGAVGIYGWPGTWPPPRLPGFVVPSHLARDERTWPPGLSSIKALDRLQQTSEREPSLRSQLQGVRLLARVALRHRVGVSTIGRLGLIAARLPRASADERRLLLRVAKLELGAAVFADLRRRFRPELAAFHTFLADFAMHRYWRHWRPELFGVPVSPDTSTLRDAIPDTHERIDRVLGRLVAASAPDTIVAVVSEHGMAPEIEPVERGDVYWSIQGSRLLQAIGLRDAAIPCPVARWIAFRPPAGRALPPELAGRLRAVVLEQTGSPLFQVDEHGGDVIVKLDIQQGPDPPRGDVRFSTLRLGERSFAFTEVAKPLGARRSAMHAENGVVVVAGPGIRPDLRIEGATAVDVAPTLLRAAGRPVPNGLDGRALDVFE